MPGNKLDDFEVKILPEPNNIFHREYIRHTDRTVFHLPAYGYLREINVKLKTLTPNMDASKPLRFEIMLTDGSGNDLLFDVEMICEGVK